MADMIKFYKGALANLPATGTNGALYITTDEGAIYLGTGVGMKRLGDFVQVDAVANLPESANQSALYYCVAENVLAKWTGTEWKQVNKQPTKEELKVMLGLDADGDVTKAIAAAKKSGDDAQADVDTLTEYVGTFTHDTAKTVVEYINAKTDGIATSGNLEALGSRVTAVEGDVSTIKGDYLKSSDRTALEGQISAVQTAVDNEKTRAEGIESGLRTDVDAIKADYLKDEDKTALQDGIDAVAEDVAEISKDYLTSSDKTALESKMATDIADAVKDEADLRVAADEAIEAKIGTVAEGKTVVQMIEEAEAAATYNDTQVKADIKANADAIDAIEADYLKAADKTELQGNIDEVAGDVADIAADYLKASDKTELQGKIDAKVAQTDYDAKVAEIAQTTGSLQTQINTIMNNPDAEGAINSINEFTAWVAEHGTIADGMRTDINKNKDDIAAEVKRAGDAEEALSGRLDTLEAIDHNAYVAADTALKNELNGEIAKKADATALADAVQALEGADTGLGNRITALENKFGGAEGSVEDMIADAQAAAEATAAADATQKANAAEAAAKSHADGLNTAMNARVEALETIDHDHDNKTVLDGITAAKVADWDDAVTKEHEHTNKTVLDGITAENVTTWNTVTSKAAQTDLDNAVTRIGTAEGKITALETASATHALKTEVEVVETALSTYETENNAAVALKANTADVYAKTETYTKDEVEALLTWGSF